MTTTIEACCVLNSGFLIFKPSEASLVLISRVLQRGGDNDQTNLIDVLDFDFGFISYSSNVASVCKNDTLWNMAENDVLTVLTETEDSFARDDKLCELMSQYSNNNIYNNNNNSENTNTNNSLEREPGHVVILSQRWMNAEGCVRDNDPKAQKMRMWQNGDWQVHFYGCGHPTKRSTVLPFMKSVRKDSSLIEIPRTMISYDWSQPDSFQF